MTDSNKLKAKIMECGYTQAEVAQKIGISAASLNNKIQNKTPFNSNEMFALCELLSIDEPRLIFFTNNSD
jgi:DNA-binding XRE family transcriptional regulator